MEVEDELANKVVVVMDPVALQPSSVKDPNGNFTVAGYDALGRLTAVAVEGKSTESLGDDLTDPTVSYTYDLARWVDSGLPARVLVTSRTEHGGSDFLLRYTYSDGGGNVVQEKVSAEDGEVPGTSGTVSPRWVGTGRVVLNNKGLPVKQYEPFFSATEDYESEDAVVATGVSSTITYDALGRVTRVDLPNGTFRTIQFTPWTQVYADENDTVLDSAWYAERSGSTTASAEEQEAATKAAAHANTPSTVLLDALGRPYETQELLAEAGTPILTKVTLDLAGNPTEVHDDKGLNATSPYTLQTQTFDMLGRPLKTSSSDAGDTLALLDVAGQPVALFKSGDLGIAYGYDELRRRTTTTVLEGTAGASLDDILTTGSVREVMQYGEVASGTPADDNLLGKPWRAWDPAGRVESTSYDFKGNLLSSERKFWNRTLAGTDQVTWAASPSATNLEATSYSLAQEYDALNRVVEQTAPDSTVTENTYNAAGLLETVTAGGTTVVTAIAQNARGQRESITYGNGITISYSYDADTFRLKTLRAVRASDSAVLQELTFWYDPVGNITRINNTGDTGGTLYFANVAVTANQTFTYDALYRLTQATGREKTSLGYVQSSNEPAFGDRPDVNTAVQAFTQTYTYDTVGNIATMVHDVAGSSTYDWSKAYTYAADSNRLDEVEVTATGGPYTDTFTHDDRGNIVYLPGMRFSSALNPNIETDFRDQIVKVHLATSGHYAVYWQDGGGQRVRKVVVKGGTTEERRYVGPYEVWTSNVTSGGQPSERTTLHVMDGRERVLLRETLTEVDGSPVTPVVTLRYQLGNHLGTACIETDGDGNILSYEEFHPYGTTAWIAEGIATVSLKRYKFTGMERDEETGLQCHGVRYYAPWLGRWASADPIGLGDGVNRFGYCHGGVVSGLDPSGLEEKAGAAAVFDRYRGWTEAARAGMIFGARDALLTPAYGLAMWVSMDEQANPHDPKFQEKRRAAEKIVGGGNVIIDAIPGVAGSREYAAELLSRSGDRLGVEESSTIAGLYSAVTSVGVGYATKCLSGVADDLLTAKNPPATAPQADPPSWGGEFVDDGGAPQVGRDFPSKDPLVGQLAEELDMTQPGRVLRVNTEYFDVEGNRITDVDIETTTHNVSVKSGTKLGGAVVQAEKATSLTGKPTVTYAPNLKPGALKAGTAQGADIAMTRAELYAKLGMPE